MRLYLCRTLPWALKLFFNIIITWMCSTVIICDTLGWLWPTGKTSLQDLPVYFNITGTDFLSQDRELLQREELIAQSCHSHSVGSLLSQATATWWILFCPEAPLRFLCCQDSEQAVYRIAEKRTKVLSHHWLFHSGAGNSILEEPKPASAFLESFGFPWFSCLTVWPRAHNSTSRAPKSWIFSSWPQSSSHLFHLGGSWADGKSMSL